MRQHLPDRRPSMTFDLVAGGMSYAVTIARFDDGRLAEIFIAGKKIGSDLDTAARDSAVLRDGEGKASGPLACALDRIEETT